MSDIKEEQKRLYKRAEENDIKLLQDRINKAIEYIKENEKEYGSLEDNEKIILNILKGDNK